MRIRALDAARGVAASLVAVDHLILVLIDPAPGSPLFLLATASGSFGVGLFFLISGFVIPLSLKRGPVDFAIRRVFRIYPVAIAGVGVAVAVNAVIGWPSSGVLATSSLFGMYLRPNESLVLPLYWTLTVEVTFYLIAGIVGTLTRRAGGRSTYVAVAGVLIAIIVALNILSTRSMSTFETGLTVALSCLPLLMAGWFVYLFSTGAIDLALLVIGLGVVFIALTQSPYPYFSWTLGAPTWIAAFALFAWLVLGRPPGAMRRFAAPLGVLGLLTFDIYVVHVPVIFLVGSAHLPLPVGILLAVVVILGLSAVVHLVVERPFMTMGRRLAAATHRPPRTSPPSPDAVETGDAATDSAADRR